MLQCNRCRMQLPDGTQSCTRCGGTVLTPVQTQSQQQRQTMNNGQQRPRPQGQSQNSQARPNVPTGQRPQRPPMNRQTQQMRGQQMSQLNDDFFGEGFDEIKSTPNQQMGVPQFNNQTTNTGQMSDQQMGGQAPNQQMGNPVPNKQQNKKQAKQPSKDGSSIKDWIIMMVCMLVPVVNIWYIFTTLSKKSTAPDYKKNYIKAYLIYFVVMSILSFVVTALFSDSLAYWIAATFLTNG